MTLQAQQAAILEQMSYEKFMDAQKASNHQTFAEELREEGRALKAGAAALRSAVPETREQEENDSSAALIGQPIPNMAGTEPRLNFETRMAWLFQQAANDENLTDAEVRNIVRVLSIEQITAADIRRTKELITKHGWE